MSYELRSEILRKRSYQGTSMGTQILVPQKEKNTFLYTNMLYHRPCFFLLKQIKVNFKLGKHTLSIVNHFKAWKIRSLQGFIQKMVISILIQNYWVKYIFSKTTCCAVNGMPQNPLDMYCYANDSFINGARFKDMLVCQKPGQ